MLKKCIVCKEWFEDESPNQARTMCYKEICKIHRKRSNSKIYYKQKKQLSYTRKQSSEFFPKWKCNKCGAIIQLDFYPTKNKIKWEQWQCPKCNEKQV